MRFADLLASLPEDRRQDLLYELGAGHNAAGGTVIEFEIPGPPQCKERARTVRTKKGKVRSFTPARTAAFEREVERRARAAGARPVLGPMRLRLQFFVPDARRRDLDNLTKAVLDGLNKVAFADDSQIVELEASKEIDRARPRSVVRVEALASGAPAAVAISRRIVRKDAPAARTGSLAGAGR